MAVTATARATTTIHMPTITAMSAVTIRVMRLATASSVSLAPCSGARTVVPISANNPIRYEEGGRIGRFFYSRRTRCPGLIILAARSVQFAIVDVANGDRPPGERAAKPVAESERHAGAKRSVDCLEIGGARV